jgi:hypothetical protein
LVEKEQCHACAEIKHLFPNAQSLAEISEASENARGWI